VSTDSARPARLPEYRFINLCRAVAAAWVAFGHCMIWSGWKGLPTNPKSAVTLFMMISGFLMVENANKRIRSEPMDSYRGRLSFYLRRYFRIAPVYYLALAISVIFAAPLIEGTLSLQSLDPAAWPAGGKYDPSHFGYSPTNIILHTSFLFGLFPNWSLSSLLPDWSLSLEMQFYAAFPFMYTFIRNTHLSVVRCLLIGAMGIGGATSPHGTQAILNLHCCF